MRRKAAERAAQAEVAPDLVDRIFELIEGEYPQLSQEQIAEGKAAVREELGGAHGSYIRKDRSDHEQRRAEIGRQILRRFNGCNAREVARELGVSRATVYRYLKQPGISEKLSQVTARLETAALVASTQPIATKPTQASLAEETD